MASYLLFMVMCIFLPGMFAPNLFEHADSHTLSETMLASILIWISTFCSLAAARVFLETRASVPAKNYLLQVFQALDSFFVEMNQVTGGVVLAKDTHLLPDKKPVAWRETSKKSMGTVRYLFRVLVVLEVPLLCAFQMISSSLTTVSVYSVTVLLYLLWGIAAALIAVHAAGLVSSERSRQTLEVLLTTPVPGREIIRQKFRGVLRLFCVLLVPFISIFAFECWFNANYGWEYFTWSFLLVLIYLSAVAWTSMYLGLRIRSQIRAVLAAVALLIVVVGLPVAVPTLLAAGPQFPLSEAGQLLRVLSPAIVIPAVESGDPAAYGIPDPYRAWYLVNAVCFGFLAWTSRWLCLRDADRILGRAVQSSADVKPADAPRYFLNDRQPAPDGVT